MGTRLPVLSNQCALPGFSLDTLPEPTGCYGAGRAVARSGMGVHAVGHNARGVPDSVPNMGIAKDDTFGVACRIASCCVVVALPYVDYGCGCLDSVSCR